MTRRMRLLLGAGACAALAAWPALAPADNRLTLEGTEINLKSDDPGVANEFLIEVAGTDVRFREPKDPAGFTYPLDCTPRYEGDRVTEVTCPKNRIKSIVLDAGPAEDKVTYKLTDIPGNVEGGTGADSITSSEAPDTLSGGQGNDTLVSAGGDDDLDGGAGGDTIDAGAGNDSVTDTDGDDTINTGAGDDKLATADGSPDKIDCGEGNDSITIDQLDAASNCETIVRKEVAAVEGGSAADDKTAPKLEIGGSAVQYAGTRNRSVRFVATCSEKGLIQAGGFLDAGGVNAKLKSVSATVPVGGAGALMALKLTKRQAVKAAKSRRSSVRVTVSCVDAAGNTSRARHFKIRLKRR